MKIVIVDTSIPINTRNTKIENSFRKFYPNAEIIIISWRRDDTEFEAPSNYLIYEAKAEYGNPIAKLKKMRGFSKFVNIELQKIQPDIIIASHWDSLLITPDTLVSKPILIYENLDVPTGPYPIRKAIQILEKRKLRSFDLIVHASRFFKELYPKSIPQIILENISTFNFELEKQGTHNPFVVSYIGTVRYKDILEHFIKAACSIDNIQVKIFGDGQDLAYLKEYSKSYKNIIFYGGYSFSQIPQIYSESDLVWAAYPNKDYNVIYAISNKFHESMACGKPCIYAEHTKLGDYVTTNNIGYIVNPYSEDKIRKLLLSVINDIDSYNICKNNLISKKQNAATWDQDFEKIISFINKKIYGHGKS